MDNANSLCYYKYLQSNLSIYRKIRLLEPEVASALEAAEL